MRSKERPFLDNRMKEDRMGKTSCREEEKSTTGRARHTCAPSLMQESTTSMPTRRREDLWTGRRPSECRRGEASHEALVHDWHCVPDAAPNSAEHVCVP